MFQNKSCSCVDCEASCPAAPPMPPIPLPFTIYGVDGNYAIAAVIFVLGSIVILFCVFVHGNGK